MILVECHETTTVSVNSVTLVHCAAEKLTAATKFCSDNYLVSQLKCCLILQYLAPVTYLLLAKKDYFGLF